MKRILFGFFILIAPAIWAMEPQDAQAPANADDATIPPCPDADEKIKKQPPSCCMCGDTEHLLLQSSVDTSRYMCRDCIEIMCGNCINRFSMK